VLPPARIAQFVGEGFPIVCLDRDIDSATVPLVQVDNRLGARLATEHLLELGHRRIAHVAGIEALRISAHRIDGYRDALSAAGIAYDSALVVCGSFTEQGGFAAARALLEHTPTAIFAANDLSAVGVVNALTESGLRVPADVSVVGFDDVRLAAYTSPPLTTVHQPAREIAQLATQLLFELTAGRPVQRTVRLLEPRLVVRRSTAPPSDA
jgi:DNA-binding LacI/PurR family transcriptional regulator